MQLNKMPSPPVRMLLSGWPGTGKTGALAALANAGWKIRLLDFDGNYEVLKNHVNRDADFDVCTFEDPIRMGSRTMGVDGVPVAFDAADRILDRWRYKEGDAWVDLGASKQWGQDHIVCLDGLSGLSQACWNKALVFTNAVVGGDMRRVYDFAGNEQLSFIRRLTAESNGYHFICISHLKLIGPPEIGKNEETHVKEAKKFAGEVIPTRLYPTALGSKLSYNIAGEFPTSIRAIVDDTSGKPKRMLEYLPTTEVDLKLPASPERIASLGKLEAATGLVKLFAALGHEPPKKEEKSA